MEERVDSGDAASNELNLCDELFAICSALETAGIDYAVCDNLALVLHGLVQCMDRMDFLVRRKDMTKATEIVTSAGFVRSSKSEDSTTLAGIVSGQWYSKGGKPDRITVKLIEVEPHWWDAWSTRRTYKVGDRTLRALTRDGFLQMNRQAGGLHAAMLLEQMKEVGGEVDMSPGAIARRFNELSQLWRLCCALRGAKDLGPVERPKKIRNLHTSARK